MQNVWGQKMTSYATVDDIPDLTSSQMASAIRLELPYYGSNTSSYYTALWFPVRQKEMLLKFEGKKGGTYGINTNSVGDPDSFDLIAYDDHGNAIAKDVIQGGPGETSVIAQNIIFDFVTPYSGDYYIRASWDNGKFLLDETVTVSMRAFDTDRIFDWGEAMYPELFPEHQLPIDDVSGYYARIYSNGDAVGEKDGNIYYYDSGAGGSGEIVHVGTVSDFLTLAQAAGF